MKKNIFPIVSILLLIIYAGYSYQKYRIAPGFSFSKLELINEKKETSFPIQKDGKWKVISFYASWCIDCKREFPNMKKAMETNLSDFSFIAITDEGYEKMISYKYTNEYPFQFFSLLKDFENYQIYAIPTTYILNPENEIVYGKIGSVDWQSIRSLMKN